MLFRNIFKKRKKTDTIQQNEISKELFGKRILSRMILTSGKKYFELMKEIGIEATFINYLLYLQYHLFLAERILEQRYSQIDVKVIITATIDGLVDFIDGIPVNKKNEAKNNMKKMYWEINDYAKGICNDLGSEQGLKNLADAFIEDCGTNKDLLRNVYVFTHFSHFVINHTEDILNDNIVITDATLVTTEIYKEKSNDSQNQNTVESVKNEIHEIVIGLLGIEKYREDITNFKNIINEIVEEEDVRKKTELLESGLDLCLELLEEGENNYSQVPIGSISLTTFIYYRIFVECVLAMDTDIIEITEMYTRFQISKHIHPELHPYVQMMIRIYDLLDRGIRYLYENVDSITKDYFRPVEKRIRKMLLEYTDDNTDWNKIFKF